MVSLEPTSIIDSPVTQLADVEVKKASIKDNGAETEEDGSIKKIVPVIIKSKKPAIVRLAGDLSREF